MSRERFLFLSASDIATSFSEFEIRGSDVLLIIFAHRDAERFAFHNATESLDCDRLFLRDPALRSWYNKGIPGFGDDLETITQRIKTHIKQGRYTKTYSLGSSMGAYAAILFGVLAEVDRVIAFNPQTLLDRVFPLSPSEDVEVAVSDLNHVLQGHNATRIDVVISQDDAVDLFHAANISEHPDVHVWTAPGTGHTLTDQLNRRGELKRLLRQWSNGRSFDALQSVDCLHDQTFADKAKIGIRGHMAGDHDIALPALTYCAGRYPAHCGLSLFLGLTAAELGRLDLAVPALRAALTLRPTWSHAEETLRSILDEGLDALETPPPVASLPLGTHPDEFTGIGSDINAALIDAIGNVTGSAKADAEVSVEVVAWGVQNVAVGGAKSFWTKVRRILPC